MVAASGIAAACTRPLTAVAPASTAAEPNKFLREIMVCAPSSVPAFVLSLMTAPAHGRCAGHNWHFTPTDRAAAHHGHSKVHGREPKLPLRLDAGVDGCRALPHFRQQPETSICIAL